MQPWVSVICLCYNHQHFLAEALDSVLAQTYPNVEIIVLDDASTDGSREVIQSYCDRFPQIRFIQNEKNRGNCAAFNRAWRQSRGAFIIDFATDDVMMPARVAGQVKCFSALDSSYGVVYTDVQRMDERSRDLGTHYKRSRTGELLAPPPSGDVFVEILKRYFIDPTSMMIRREVLEDLGGYDETLAYEDFDFWVRSSRTYKYFYLDCVLTKRRLHKGSLSRKVYGKGDAQLASTITVCQKATHLIRVPEEKEALIVRLKSELRQAFFTENFAEAEQLLGLLSEQAEPGRVYQLMGRLIKCRVRLSFLRKVYYRLRYGQ